MYYVDCVDIDFVYYDIAYIDLGFVDHGAHIVPTATYYYGLMTVWC